MNFKRKITVLFVSVMLILIGFTTNGKEANAAASAGTREQAYAAYYNLLTQKTIPWGNFKLNTRNVEYTFEDVNGDKVPELLLYNTAGSHADGYYKVYTFTDGKAKSIGVYTYLNISKNKNFFVDLYSSCGISRVNYYRLKNGKRISLASYYMSETYPSGIKNVKKVVSGNETMYFYKCKVNGSSTTYSKCMNKVNSLESNAEYIYVYWAENYFYRHKVDYKENKFKYNGYTYYTGYMEDDCYPNVYRVNKSGIRKMLQYDSYIIKHRKQYMYTQNNAGDFGLDSLYVINGETGKIRRLTTKSDGKIATTKKYAYYPVYSKYKDNSVTFKVYKCKLNGLSKKAVTKKITAKSIKKVTSSYVQYKKNGKQYRYYYSSGKVKKVS